MTKWMRSLLVLSAGLALGGPVPRPAAADLLQPGGRVWLHAHNCYPEKGLWADRIGRALAQRTTGLAIEQDVAWRVDPKTGAGQSVVSHDLKLTGDEPTLEAHFFDTVRPLMARALAENKRETWPVLVLHLDFKSNEPVHHQAVWELLGRHLSWLTTAERVADESRVTPFAPGPLLVLTENGEGQVDTFYTRVPVGGQLRIFGTIPAASFPAAKTAEDRARAVFEATPEVLIQSRAGNYRRWTNFAWNAVELGGQGRAGDWTPADEARLRALVARAHAMGLWVRFYTLNGHPPGRGLGWTESYNFGSVEAMRTRLQAAVDAGVEFIATDQYEELERVLAASRK
jgi:hypothetical protein